MKKKMMSSALLLSDALQSDTNLILPCLFFYLLAAPHSDPANLTGKQEFLITICSGLQGLFFLEKRLWGLLYKTD